MSLLNFITGADDAADAALEAGRLQAEAADRGTEEISRQFDITRKDLAPTIEAGNLARDQQTALLGLDGEEAQQTAVDSINESPAQEFIRKRAQRNLLQNSAAIGGIGGGNVRTALAQQGAGFAAQDTENQFNRLQQLSSPGTATATNLGQFGQQTAQSVAQGINRSAEAQASGILGAGQARAQGISSLIGAATTGLFGAKAFGLI